MRREKKLYRKVNTRTKGVHHDFGVNFDRNNATSKMVKKRRGLDYTPLYKYLLKNVGKKWDEIYAKIKHRINDTYVIYEIVDIHSKCPSEEDKKYPYVRIGESSFYSKLYVNEQGLLQKVDPLFNETSMYPVCSCCTHTFNGIRFTKKYVES